MDTLSLVSINIEGNNHWDTVLPFLDDVQPDVLCLQEVFEDQLVLLDTFPYIHFTPNTRRPYWNDPEGPVRIFGTAIASRLPLSNARDVYYAQSSTELPIFKKETAADKRATHWYGCSIAEIESFKIITTQFLWTPDGMPDDAQRTSLDTLRTLLANEGAYVLCGDFNIPREQNALYATLTESLIDHIPKEYTCSLDAKYHKTRTTTAWAHVQQYMVDYLLTTASYGAEHVRLHEGVSDHKAIVATITRT